MGETDTNGLDSRIRSVDQLDGRPEIVHISDIHGYLDVATSALTTVGEAEEYDPLVESDNEGTLRWAGNDYVVIFNGDLIDRGPNNKECIELVRRLQQEAPPGRVHYHVGNHEMAVLLPTVLGWRDTYSITCSDSTRRRFLTHILDGKITAAFRGYEYSYTHAGCNDHIHPAEINASLRKAATTLLEQADASHQSGLQSRVMRRHPDLFELGEDGGRGPSAGIFWLDFQHLDPDAPPQIVGHTKRTRPVRDGNVVCGNVLRMNRHTPGGEGVLVESQSGLEFVRRCADGSVTTTSI